MLTGRWGPAHLARRRLPPPHRCVRSGPGCATGPPADSGLQPVRPPHVGEPHRYCKQMQLYRARHHDAAVLWLFNHLATRRRTTAIYEQKVWVDTEARNQKPDLFLPDLNRAIDVGIVRPEAMGTYYAQKIKAYSTRTIPIIVGTNGTLHPNSAAHLKNLGIDIPKFMAFTVFSMEYQHHKATLAYMTRMNATLTERAVAVSDGYGTIS